MKGAVVLLIAYAALSTAGDGDKSTMFKVTTKKADDSVEVRADKDKTVFVIKSPSGISQAVVERTDDKWPEVVLLRLNLKGLESFRATNGKVTLEAAVSSQKEGQRVRLWRDGKEDAPLDNKSQFWMDIRMIGGDGKLAKEIPLKAAYFEMQLPKAFFEGNPKSITLNWIDYYRN